jgi:hypothetical protein
MYFVATDNRIDLFSEVRYCEISKEMSSLYFGLAEFGTGTKLLIS